MTGLPTSDDPRPGAHADDDPRLLELGWKHVYSGKVRELYVKDDEPGRVLVVASDRVSAFDHVLEPAIPGKGAMLTQLSMWWFRRLGVPHHLVAAHPALGEHLPEGIAERARVLRIAAEDAGAAPAPKKKTENDDLIQLLRLLQRLSQ